MADFVKIEKGLGAEGRIAVVRFDRGDGINALSPDAMRELTEAAESFDDDAETSVVDSDRREDVQRRRRPEERGGPFAREPWIWARCAGICGLARA